MMGRFTLFASPVTTVTDTERCEKLKILYLTLEARVNLQMQTHVSVTTVYFYEGIYFDLHSFSFIFVVSLGLEMKSNLIENTEQKLTGMGLNLSLSLLYPKLKIDILTIQKL